MFSLIYNVWRLLFRKEEYQVVLLGLDNAGKTTFLEQAKTKLIPGYTGVNLSRITSTVGLNIGRLDTAGIRVNFWDLGGQSDLQCLWDKYYSESHAVIYIVDSDDPGRLEDSKAAYDKMIKNETLTGVPVLLVSNKMDSSTALRLERIKEIFQSDVSISNRNSSVNNCPDEDTSQEPRRRSSSSYCRDWHAVAVSALTGEGVVESINWIANCVKRNRDLRPPITQDE